MGLFYAPTLGADSIVNVLMKFSAVDLIWVVPLLLLYLWFGIEGGKFDAFSIFATVVLSIVISYLLGLLYSHPAPYMGAHTLLSGPPENSFPSQHTAVVFSVVWPLVWLKRWRASVLVAVLGVLIGFARVYVGVHFPIDIAGGVVASLAGFALVYIARDPIRTVAGRCIRIEEQFWTVIGNE